MEIVQEVCVIAEELAQSNGILRKTPNGPTTLPVTLFPSPFPAALLRLAASLQCEVNMLYHRVAMDHDFLEKTLKPTFALDDYLRRLWCLYTRVKNEGIVQSLVLGLNRSDYMVHTLPQNSIKQLDRLSSTQNASRFEEIQDNSMWSGLSLCQVEVNMIATSFCGLSPRMVSQHRQVLALVGYSPDQQKRIPDCDSSSAFADAMAKAANLYVNHVQNLMCQSIDVTPCILVIVSAVESNVYDQRALLGSLLVRHPQIHILIRTFSDLAPSTNRLVINGQRRLFVDGQEIALIYYRHGYAPDHFPTDETWETKYQLERSRAIKCPCVQYLLANTKLVQATLCQPEQLARFIDPQSPNFKPILSTFARQYPLSNASDLISTTDMERLLDECRANPERFVLKPQREGGGNNYFGDEIVTELKRVLDQDLGASYVLMDRFYPYVVKNYVLGWENPDVERNLVLELGIFGAIIACGEQVILNEQAGHLLRTKSVDSNEGGIVAGFGCLDSPFLV